MKLHIFCCFLKPNRQLLECNNTAHSSCSRHSSEERETSPNPLIVGLATHLREQHPSMRNSMVAGSLDMPPKYEDIFISVEISSSDSDDPHTVLHHYPPPPSYEDSIKLALTRCTCATSSPSSSRAIAAAAAYFDQPDDHLCKFHHHGSTRSITNTVIFVEDDDDWAKPPKSPLLTRKE